MDVPNVPEDIPEPNKIPRVWKPAYVWPADNDGIIRVVGGHDNPNVAEHRRHWEWARAMGQETGPVVNHVVSAITIEEFHHEHFPMIKAYQGLSPMQAEFLDLVPDQLNVSNRSSTALLDLDSDSEYSEHDAEAPMESFKNINSHIISLPSHDTTLDASICTATSPHAIFAFPFTPTGPISPGTPSELFTPIWSTITIPTHTFREEYLPTDIILEKLRDSRTLFPNLAPKDEGICAITLIDRLDTPNDLSAPGSPTSTSSDIPNPPVPITDSGLVASAVNRPINSYSNFESSTLETSSSADYLNPFGSSNFPVHPFEVDQHNGAMILDTDGLVKMTAGLHVDMVVDANMSNMDKLLVDPAIADASTVSAAVIFSQDDSPRPQKGKGVDELIDEEQAPNIDNSSASITKQEFKVGRSDPGVDKWARNFDKGTSMGPVASWRRSTVRLKELGRKLLKPDPQEQRFLVAIEGATKGSQVGVTVKSNKKVESNGKPPPLPPKDDPVTSPKPNPVTVSPTSLGPGEQSLLYSRLEYMVCETANTFLVEQYLQGRIDQQTISRVVDGWAFKNLPRVPEFRFDQATQRDLINANRRTMQFAGKCSANPVQLVANLRAWKSVIQDMTHRTFSIRDSAIRKMMYETGEVLEMLNASVKTLQAFDELRTNVHRYMFTPPGSPASPLLI